MSHSKLASRLWKIIAGLSKLKEQPQSRTLYSMGFPGRVYVVDIGITFIFRKEFQGGKLVGTESSFVSCHETPSRTPGSLKKPQNNRILLHPPDPRDSHEWLMLRVVSCSTGSQLQPLGESPCAPFPARNDSFRAQLISPLRSQLE